jgi:hypothetical protein
MTAPKVSLQTPSPNIGTVQAEVYLRQPIIYYNHTGGMFLNRSFEKYQIPRLNTSEYEAIMAARLPYDYQFPGDGEYITISFNWDIFGLGPLADKLAWLSVGLATVASIAAILVVTYRCSPGVGSYRSPEHAAASAATAE